MLLIDLPFDILSSLPFYIRNIEDFTEASSTCRTLYQAFSTTAPNTILRLAAASSPTFFVPRLLIIATARQVSDWALQSPSNTLVLRGALQGGIDGLLELCIDKAGLTLEDIRRLHLANFDLINPFSDKIDKIAGKQWYQTPNFWEGGVSAPNTIWTEADSVAYQNRVGIYRAFDLDVRLDYIKYCIPDWICDGGYPGMEVLMTGPYVASRNREEDPLPCDQISLRHVLHCARWRRLWNGAMQIVGPDFEEEWKQKLWFDVVQYQGLEGLEMLKDDGVSEKWQKRLRTLYDQISKLKEEDRPGQHEIGNRRNPVSYAPDFRNEVHVCMAKYWPGTEVPGDLGSAFAGDDSDDSGSTSSEENNDEESRDS
ncbi:hypothetical protein VNI00_010982 [Paramarasmius palmivorus]|uniref:F-box domain-containing protein n=1 Tax=Paramarasmius palmivorus TaxID=297713 RepID=A0AAW0CC21_9AGAR